MKHDRLSMTEALKQASAFPWAMIQTYSRLYLGVNPLTDGGSSPAEIYSFFQGREQIEQSLLEARFFSDAEELRLFRLDGGLRAVLAAETDGDRWLEETCEIANKDKFGGSVTVRRVIDFDEDGQAYVAFTRLSGWEGAKQHE